MKDDRCKSCDIGTHGIYCLGLTLLYSLIGAPANGVARSRSVPIKRLKALKVSRSLIVMLRRIYVLGPKSQNIAAAECVQTLQRCFSEKTDDQVGRRKRSYRSRAVFTGAAMAVIVCLVYLARPVPIAENSIAILPFQNLSGNSYDALFVEEVRDDIRTRLVNTGDIKVINTLDERGVSRTGRQDWKVSDRNWGARFLLDGSLRHDKDELLFHVSLVDAKSHRPVWSQEYRRRLGYTSNLQEELAGEVTETIKEKLIGPERLDIMGKTTTSPDAYVLYLQGRQLERNPASSVSSYKGAEAFYRQAIALDPEYALAHSRLAIMAAALYRFRGPSTELEILAESEARKALSLAPNLGEAHLAMSLYYYRIKRDFNLALAELVSAQRLIPHDGEIEATRAYIHRRQARWREALAEQHEALRLDSLNQDYERELEVTACLLRDWPGAAYHSARAVLLARRLPHLQGEKALVSYWRDGDLKPLQEFFESLVGFGDEEGNLTWSRWDAALLSREIDRAFLAIKSFPRDTLPSVGSAPIPKAYLEACTFIAAGDKKRASLFFEMARSTYEAETKANPNDAMRHARLGLLYAYMGRKEDALREGQRAVDITPVSEDAVEGHQWLCNLALIHARVGDADGAIRMIESLLRQPGCVSPLNEACMTLWDLRLRWQWDPLREDPRFQQILAGPEPETVY